MDVSKQEGQQEEPGGEELIQELILATGLPGKMVEQEIHEILDETGVQPAELTLDQLRAAMIAYLESVHRDFSESEAELTDELPPSSDA